MESHSYTAPARVKALLVPLGNVSEAAFKEYVEKVRSSFEVRLVDVTPTENSLFNPQGFPNGRVIYDFQLSLNDQESIFLHDFEPFRKTFVVIGITDNTNCSLDDITNLSKLYKSSITHTAIVFGSEMSKEPNGGNIFYQSKTNIETILCDITRIFLNDLAAYLSSFQHITLRSPGTIGSNDRIKSLESKKKRISSGSSLSLSLSDSSNPKLSLSSSTERRQFKVKGRQLKILGSLYLLAGKYNDALKEFNEAVPLLRNSSDYLWLGSTLEGIGVCLVMLTFLGVPYQMPSSLNSVLHTTMTIPTPSSTPGSTPRNSIAVNGTGTASSDITRFSTPELIHHITVKVLYYYEVSQNDHEDYVPQLVYCEAILRFVKFMCVVNIGGGFNSATIDHIVRGKKIFPKFTNALFEKMDILKFSNKILTVQLKDMDILSQAKIYSTLASIYGDLNLLRKRSFILRTLFVSLIPELSNHDNSTKSYELSELLDTILSIYGIGRSPESNLDDSFSSRWVQLHKSVIQLCIIVCTKIGDHRRVVLFKSLLLTRYCDSLTDNEQSKLLNEIQSICRINDVPFAYFDPFLVRNLEIIKPTKTPKKQQQASITENKDDPFIYNPYAKPATSDDIYLVQDEFVEFQVSIQNPFSFQLNISDIQIDSFETFRTHFMIQPKAITTLSVLAKPLKSGAVRISAINIKIFDCQLQSFKIAKTLKTEIVEKLKNDKPRDLKVLEEFQDNLDQNKIEKKVNTGELNLDVISSQPNIQILSKPDHLMLLEGGSERLQLTIKNNSPVTANHLEYSVWDSTIDPLKNVLNNKGLPANEVYEIEYFLFKNPLKILNEATEIKPFETITLDLEIQGKRGMHQVNLILDYGNKVENEIYTRRVEVPIRVMVNPSTDLAGCDIVPLVQHVSSERGDVWKYINSVKDCNVSDFALFLVDVRNVWNKTLDIDINYEEFNVKESIVPLETKRLLIPIKRIKIEDDDNLKMVPSLSNRQYILPKITKAEDQFIKEAFWYREEILKRLSGTWSVGDVNGNIEFRGVRLSQRMLSVLKVGKIDIKVTIEETVEQKGSHHLLKTDQFFNVSVKLHNNTVKAVGGVLRNVPIASNYGTIDRRLLFNGVLQQPLENAIQPGEIVEIKIGAVILEKGEYEWGAILDDSDSDQTHIARNPLRIRAF